MQKYSMTCTCGQAFTVEAATQEEAVTKMKEQMTPEAVKAHWDEKHAGQPMPGSQDMEKMFASLAPAM